MVLPLLNGLLLVYSYYGEMCAVQPTGGKADFIVAKLCQNISSKVALYI